MPAFPCLLYRRMQVRLDGRFCNVHAEADMQRIVCLTYLCLYYAAAGFQLLYSCSDFILSVMYRFATSATVLRASCPARNSRRAYHLRSRFGAYPLTPWGGCRIVRLIMLCKRVHSFTRQPRRCRQPSTPALLISLLNPLLNSSVFTLVPEPLSVLGFWDKYTMVRTGTMPLHRVCS